jgi:hypothetical protein
MKAKVKSLGSVVDLSEYVYDEDGNEYTWNEVELIDDDKWQHYRIQASIAAMQGQLANDESVKQMIETLDYVSLPDKTKAYMNLVAQSSVMLADALIAELQKKQD